MPGPRTIRDILASPSPTPAPASPARPRTIRDILSQPASSPVSSPRPTRSIQDIIGSTPATPRFEMPPELPANYTPPAVELPRPYWEPPPAPAPTPTPRPTVRNVVKPMPFTGPIQKSAPRPNSEVVPMADLVAQERARLEAEPWPTHMSPKASLAHNAAAPFLWGLKAFGEPFMAVPRALRSIPGIDPLLEAGGASLKETARQVRQGRTPQQRQLDAVLQREVDRREGSGLTPGEYDGMGMIPRVALNEPAAPQPFVGPLDPRREKARAAAEQQLYGDPQNSETYVNTALRHLPLVGGIFDPQTQTVGQKLGESSGNELAGMGLDMFAGLVGPLAAAGKVGNVISRAGRGWANLAARVGEGEGRLAELARVASLPVDAHASEAVSLLRNAMRPTTTLAKPPVAPTRSIQDILAEPTPAPATMPDAQVTQLERLGDNLGASHQGNLQAQRGMPRLAEAERQALASAPDPAPAPEPLPAPAIEPPAPVQAPEPVDTRGQGVQYHGSSRPVGSFDEGHYENRNIYGQGFYTTDALDVAKSYTGKGAKHTSSEPSIYQVREREPVSFFNIDQSMRENPAMARAFTDVIEQSRSGVDEALAYLEGDNPTFTDLLDEMRRVGVPRDEVQEVYDAIQHRLRAEGYGGWQHVGGKLTGKASPHQVKIYFDPAQQLELTPHGSQAPERVDAPKLRESAPRQPVSEGLPPGVTRETVDPRTVQVDRGSLADAGGVADQVEQVPDIQGQSSLFLDSAPVGVRPRSARAQVLDNAPATAPSAPPPAPAAPPVEKPPSKPFWSRMFDRPLEQRVKSQMQLNRELQDTLGMVARGEHEAPPTMFERLQNTLSGNTSPRVTYGKLAPAGSGATPAKGANGATGRYHLTRDLIEVRNPGSPGVMFHEAGHAIDTHTGFVKNAPPEIAAELERFGDPSFDIPRTDGQSSWAPGLSKMRKRQEGMAEFLRVWMNHPDFDLKAAAPKLSGAWEQFLDSANDVGRRLRRHQADARVRLRSSDQARVRAQIVEENAANAWGVNDALAAGFDRYRWIQVMNSTLEKNAGRAFAPDENSYVATRMLAGLDSQMGSWIDGAKTGGVLGFDRQPIAGMKSLKEVFQPLGESPEKFLDFRDYLVTRRANELHGRGMQSGMDADGVGRVMAELEQANPEFAAMAQDVYAWNDGILQYARDAGFLSESALESIREMNQNYIPFHRIYETAAQEFGLPRGTGGGLQASERIRAIKGSMREIVDPIETMMANAAAMISSAEKNRVGQILLKHWDDASEGIGHFVREVSEPQRMIEVNPADSIGVRQIQEALEGAGIPTDGLAPEQLADLIDLLPQIKSFQKTGQLPENTVRVKVQVPQKVVDEATGVEKMTTVDRWRLVEMKPEIYRAFTAMDEDQVHWAVNAMSGVANLLRSGATKYSPVFIINNAVRDSIEASTVSRLGSRTKGVLRPFEPLVHAAHGMRATLGSALGRYLEAGLGQAMEDVSRFTVGENLVPTGVRQVADKVRMDAPAWMTKADELMTSFIREGGMQGLDEMLTSEAGTRAAYNRVFGRMNPKSKMLTYFPPATRPYIGGAVDLATLPIRTPAAIIRMLSEGSEQMTRISEFEKGLEVIARENPKWTPAQVRRQAAFEARDLLDFSVRGSQLRAFRRMVPFLGSQMTGNYRVAQNILEGVSKGNGWGSLGGAATKMFGQAAASITLPTMMLYALNYDDPDYNQLPQDERDTFWHVRLGRGPDDFLRIAKPHFLGATFASAPERFMQRYLQKDPEAFHGFMESMVKHTMGPFGAPLQLAVSDKPFAERIAGAADLLGPAGKTALELATNHDFFRNRDIEAKWTRDPDSSAYLPSYLRSDEYSSLVAKTMARTGLGKAVGISPQQIDHAINNFTGTGGRLLVNAELDPLLASLGQGDLPKQRRRKWGGLGYTENRYASEERMLRENKQLQDLAGEARALERDLPEEITNRHADVRDAMHELKQLRKELKNATESEAVDIRRQIRELTAAISPPPGGKP